MQDTMISRVLRVSPEQPELFRRNKSRIFIAVEGESLIDTILQQPNRPMEDYLDVASRAIAQAGLGEDYGELRPVYGTQIAAAGSVHIVTQNWLKDEDGNVFDLYVSVDPDYEPFGEPTATIIPTVALQDGLAGENPLILSVDVTDLTMPYEEGQGSDEEGAGSNQQNQNSQQTMNGGNDDDRQAGGQGRVKDPEHDGRLKENREEGVNKGTNDGSDPNRQQDGQGRVKDPEHDGRLKQNIEAGVHMDDQNNQNQRQPAMARRAQEGDNTAPPPRRGRVVNKYDRRLKANRGMQRRPQDGDDNGPGSGGGSAGNGGGNAAGGQGRSGGNQARSGSGNRAEANTWPDGTPRTAPLLKLDGTPRRKPGPALGTRYKIAA